MHRPCIYIFEAELNICKIGFTSQCIYKREYQLSSKFYKNFAIKGICESFNPRQDEKLIHDLLYKHRMRGEWFNISYEEIKIRASEIRLYFENFERFELLEEVINQATWHWDEIKKYYILREEAGYDQFGRKQNCKWCQVGLS